MTPKEKYIAFCLKVLSDKRKQLNEELQKLQVSMASETKSSAGDKYETAREMINQEKNKLMEQFSEITRQEHVLSQINPSVQDKSVKSGSIVQTDKAKYFVAVSMGKLNIDNEALLAISPASPIGQMLMGKKTGDSILWRGSKEKILAVE